MNYLILHSDVVRGMNRAAVVKVSLTTQAELGRMRVTEDSSVAHRSVAPSLLTHCNQN